MTDQSLKDIMERLDRIEAIFTGLIPGGGVTDPPPDAWWGSWSSRPQRIPFPFTVPHRGDPPPVDISRYTRVQLTVAKEMIKAERARLDAMDKLIDDQIKSASRK